MSEGIYTALSGALARQTQLEQVSHNLANVDTAGFRKTSATFEAVMVDAERGVQHVRQGGQVVDLSEGRVEHTGNPLDVAIVGQGFLRVAGGEGGEAVLTRAGSLRLDVQGNLVTSDGRAVLGESGGPIQIDAVPDEILIDEAGNVWDAFGMVDRLAIVAPQDGRALRPVGGGYLATAQTNLMPSGAEVMQGSIERGNVNPVQEMTQLVTLQRHFDAMQSLIQTHKRLDQRAIEVVGANRIG